MLRLAAPSLVLCSISTPLLLPYIPLALPPLRPFARSVPSPKRPYFLSRPSIAISNPKFRVYNQIYIYMYLLYALPELEI